MNCNVTATVDDIGLELRQPSSAPVGSATGALFAEPTGTGECFGQDNTGTPYRLNPTASGGCTSAITQLSGDVTTSAASGCAPANSYVSTIRGGGGGTAEVEVSLQMDDVSPQGAGSGHGFLFGWGGTTNQSGGGYGSWVGAGGHITEFAPLAPAQSAAKTPSTLTDGLLRDDDGK